MISIDPKLQKRDFRSGSWVFTVHDFWLNHREPHVSGKLKNPAWPAAENKKWGFTVYLDPRTGGTAWREPKTDPAAHQEAQSAFAIVAPKIREWVLGMIASNSSAKAPLAPVKPAPALDNYVDAEADYTGNLPIYESTARAPQQPTTVPVSTLRGWRDGRVELHVTKSVEAPNLAEADGKRAVVTWRKGTPGEFWVASSADLRCLVRWPDWSYSAGWTRFRSEG